MEEQMQRLFQSYVTLKDYCFSQKCNVDCAFFILGGSCRLVQGKKPRYWDSNDTIIKGMHAQELQPIIENKESDENVNV